MKKCSKCNTEKSIDYFSKSGKYYNSWCNECRKLSEQNRRIKNGIIPKIKPKIKDDFHKECLKCRKILHIKKFRPNKRGRLGVASYCFKCFKKYYSDLKKKKLRQIQRNWKKSHSEVQR